MQGKRAERTIRDPQPTPAGAASGSASKDSAELSDYMSRVVPDFWTPTMPTMMWYTPPSPPKPPPPILKKGRTNRILLYNGCFNPPHHGHLAHLKHAFRYCGTDFNVVGAVVLVAGDEYLKWKLGRNGRTEMILSAFQRLNLWHNGLKASEGEDISNWCWVTYENDWVREVELLEQWFKRDGFDVEFVHLAGGDKISVNSVHHGVWGCKTTVTTDISRPLDFCKGPEDKMMLPMNLRYHTPWECIPQDLEETLKERSLLEERYRERGFELGYGAKNLIRPVYECTQAGRSPNTTYTLRLVASEPSERLDPSLSSTKVRAIIAEAQSLDRDCSRDTRKSRLEDRLRGVALRPDLLVGYVASGWENEGNV